MAEAHQEMRNIQWRANISQYKIFHSKNVFCHFAFWASEHMHKRASSKPRIWAAKWVQTDKSLSIWENNNYIIIIDQQPHQTFTNISWCTLMGQLKGKFIVASILATYMVRDALWKIVIVKSMLNFMQRNHTKVTLEGFGKPL